MRDPHMVLAQVRQGQVPAHWAVFTKKRGGMGRLFGRTPTDPDPLLVITPEGAVEYVNEKKPLGVIDFDLLVDIALQVRGSTFSDSMNVTLQVWLDLQLRDGRKVKWQASSFAGDLRAVQAVLENYGAYKALHGYVR